MEMSCPYESQPWNDFLHFVLEGKDVSWKDYEPYHSDQEVEGAISRQPHGHLEFWYHQELDGLSCVQARGQARGH